MNDRPTGTKDQSVSERMQTGDDTDTMTENTETDGQTHSGMRNELNSILPGKDPLKNLTVEQTGPNHYNVYSARNGSFTRHRINTVEGTCTCEDMDYNVDNDDTREACAHLAKVALVTDSKMKPDEMAMGQMYKLLGMLREAHAELQTEAEILRDHATATGVNRRTEEAERGSQSDTSSSSGVDPDAKAEDLVEAYSGVGIDIETSIDVDKDSGQERIWIETVEQVSQGKFSAFLQDPDLVRYDPDEKDGYVNNYVKPSEVDELIEEVF